MRRLEAGNAPSGSARQVGGPRPSGVGALRSWGLRAGGEWVRAGAVLGRGPQTFSECAAGRAAPAPAAGARTRIRRSLCWSFAFPCAWGRRVPSGWLWAPAGGPGFEGVMCPSFWRVSVAGRAHSAIPRVASCARREGADGPQLVGARDGARPPGRRLPRASPGVDR